ncbi:MAG: BrnA antitoxin family protein [Acidobacteria bacterium]|nr:BrnA antitoxin family protein [Acidobacteriota bacterium]
MKRLPRGSFKAKPGTTDLKNCKVKITMYLDADILEYFKRRAEQPNAAPYQTQINNELRGVLDSGSADTRNVKDDLLNNKKFLKALKKKLETV